MSPPRITVGVPVYNGEPYLSDALASLRAQDLSDIEIIISDNGSTDATQSICERAAADDDRIRYVRSDVNRGGTWNYNRVLELASAPLFKWSAADDMCRPTFLRRSVESLEEAGPQAVGAIPRTQLIDEDGRIFDELGDRYLGLELPTAHERIQQVLRRFAAHVIYGVYRTDVLRSTHQIGHFVGNDLVLLIELLARGPIVEVQEQLFLQRRHAAQSSAQGQAQVNFHRPGTSARGRFVFPQTRLNREMYVAVLRSELPPRERLLSLVSVLRGWTIPRWRHVASDMRHFLGIRWPLFGPRT